MAQPKSTYSFSSTKQGCDLQRIMDENPESDVIVLTRSAEHAPGCPVVTLVRGFNGRARVQEKGHRVVYVGINFAAYVGDLHAIALGFVTTKVEAY